MNKTTRAICLMLTLALLFSINGYASETSNEALQEFVTPTCYEYPIVPDTDEWAALDSQKEMLQAVQVPDELLDKMTTNQLVTVVLDNPMISLLYAYYTVDDGFNKGYETLCNQLNCVKELDSRTDAISCLSTKLSELSQAKARASSTEQLNELDSQYMICNRLTQCLLAKANASLGSNNSSSISPNATSIIVYTPNNTPVFVIAGCSLADFGITADELNEATNRIMELYPHAVKIANQSTYYNCHNYAWNTQNPNAYWMNDPQAYMTDGSYQETRSALSGYRVYYPIGNHSAIIKSNYDDNIYVRSKWGYSPYLNTMCITHPMTIQI